MLFSRQIFTPPMSSYNPPNMMAASQSQLPMAVSVRDMERVKKELLSLLAQDLDHLSHSLTQTTHELVRAAVDLKLSGVVSRLERGVAGGLAVIAQDVKERIDKEVRERYARIAGETRLRLRKLETRAGLLKDGKKVMYDPLMSVKMPVSGMGEEMSAVQAEC